MPLHKIESLEEFKTTVIGTKEAGKKVIIQFSAEWCNPCKLIAGDIDRLAETHKDKLAFFYVDIDALEDLGEMYEVCDLPALLLLDGPGPCVDSHVGSKVDSIETFLNKCVE